jgi:hypothetical protein
MPTISASPNPVGIYSASVPTFTNVEWNTESRTVGVVEYSENGSGPKALGGGAPSGNVPLQVKLGSTYRLSLKTDTGGGLVEVATAMVTTFDLRQQMAAGFTQHHVPEFRPQLITNLVVQPAVDSVIISFRTRFPTIPTTELRDDAGNWVDGKLPLLGGLRTRHRVEFGFEQGLALDRKHSFKIEAFGPNRNLPKAVAEGEFITGRRDVDVNFEVIDVLNDTDSGGAGEFSITFGVGDVGTTAALGPPQSWRGDITDRDPPVALNKAFSLTNAHRLLWLQVTVDEDDQEPWGGIAARGSRPEFEQPGGSYSDDGDLERVRLTIHVDVDTDPGQFIIPFEMRTPPWPLDFVINGTLDVRGFAGAVLSTKMSKAKLPPRPDGYLTSPGDAFGLAADGVSGRADLVALGADGAVYHRSMTRDDRNRKGRPDWHRVELPGLGAPAAVASGGSTLDLVDLDENGAVLHCEFDPDKPKRAKWRKLGGNFAYVVPVAGSGGRRAAGPSVALFGISDDGSLHVRDARGDGRDWDRLDQVQVRAVAPVSGASPALIAVASNGDLLHFGKRNGRWRPQAIGPKAPGDSPTRMLTAAVVERIDGKDRETMHRDLVIGAMNAAHEVQMLVWPDYPEGAPARWQELGPLQGLMISPAGEPKRSGKSAKGRSGKG